MRYTFRQLEYFVATGETGSITSASSRINISQTSISSAIAHLEQELGVQLIVRHHAQGLALTPMGRTMLEAAKRLVAEGEAFYRLAAQTGARAHGQISLGCFTTLTPLMMPELTRSFADQYPEAQLQLLELQQEQIFAALRRAEIETALTFDLLVPGDISFLPLASLPLQIWVGEGDPLIRQPFVDLRMLAKQRLILLDLPVIRDHILALFMKEGLEPRIASQSVNPEVVRSMVANGCGYTLANVQPRCDLALDGKRIVRLRLAAEHAPMRLGLVSSAQARKSKLVTAFEQHCRATISDFYIPGMASPDLDRHARMPGAAQDAAA